MIDAYFFFLSCLLTANGIFYVLCYTNFVSNLNIPFINYYCSLYYETFVGEETNESTECNYEDQCETQYKKHYQNILKLFFGYLHLIQGTIITIHSIHLNKMLLSFYMCIISYFFSLSLYSQSYQLEKANKKRIVILSVFNIIIVILLLISLLL
jgi:hypothetical protein